VDPFYMVGRMGGQSVVIRAEKGKVRMLLDGESGASQKELVYDAIKEIQNEHDQDPTPGLRPAAEDNRSALALERTENERAALSGDGHQCGASWPVAESGDRGDAAGAGPQKEGPAAADQPAAYAADREEACRLKRQAREALAGDPEGQGGDDPLSRDGGDETGGNHPGEGAASGRGDHEGALRADDGPAGGRTSGSLPQDLLPVGGAGALGAVIEPCGSGEWPALSAGGLRETGASAAVGAGPPGVCHFAAQDGAEGCIGRVEGDAWDEPGGKKMNASSGWWP